MQIVELNEPLNSLQKRLCRCDVEPKNTLYNLNIQYFIILQSKLKENILGRCLSTGATKFSKIVLADKKNKTATYVVVLFALLNLLRISSLSNCLTFEWFWAANFRLVSVWAKLIFTLHFLLTCSSNGAVSISVSTFLFKNKPSN